MSAPGRGRSSRAGFAPAVWMIVKGRIRLPFGWAVEFVRYYPEANDAADALERCFGGGAHRG